MTKLKEKKAPPRHRDKPGARELERRILYRRLIKGPAWVGSGPDDWFEAENRWRDNIVPQNND